MTKQYPEIDAWEQLDKVGGYYCRHVAAMTDEGLHSKSDIARQLGWRDRQIDELREQISTLMNALKPFAKFAIVRSAAGSTAPKSGTVYSVHTRLGEAEISAEDFNFALHVTGGDV